MDVGLPLTVWTIRLALVVYVAQLVGQMLFSDRPNWAHVARWLWTFGCGVFLVHVACAFHFFYAWSFQAAFDHTAEKTLRFVGFEFGYGVWVNYLFTAMWVADVAWAWGHFASYRSRPGWIDGCIHGFFLFMAFNGAVVFVHPGPTQTVALMSLFGLAALWLAMWRIRSWKQQAGATATAMRPVGHKS